MIELNEIKEVAKQQLSQEPLFQVWFDVDCGLTPTPNWWWDTEPEPCSSAYMHAAQLRAQGWVCVVLPEKQNPRLDGRWDNP